MLKFGTLSIISLFAITTHAQQLQTIRGTVTDNDSKKPIYSATILVLSEKKSQAVEDSGGNFVLPSVSSISDSAGDFLLQLPVGRYSIQVTCTGYEPVVIQDVLVGSGKASTIGVTLIQRSKLLNEVVVKPRPNRYKPLNSMATVSARVFSVEETKRYAGGMDDPARLATAFAGVAGNTDDNGIIIRGNAPKFVQWKMEGIEIPSPNHFSDLKTFGGGTLTALSSQMLANSDFYTGAFPAEYSNALSGVFDLSVRKGNDQKREHTLQVGAVGIDASSEGPFRKGAKATYLFNYRYSTLALLAPLLPENANSLRYQDLSFKLNFPTAKAGTFAVWGIGFIDKAGAKAKTDSADWKYKNDRNEDEITQYTSAFGISHVYLLKKNAFIKTTAGCTYTQVDWETKKLNDQLSLQPYSSINNSNRNITVSSFINKKFNSAHTNKTGIVVTNMNYDLLLKSAAGNKTPQEIVNARGNSTLLTAYNSLAVSLAARTKVIAGINAQFFTLNNHYTVEPRIGFKQQVGARQTISAGYGLHSRLERLNFYLNNSIATGASAVNKNLDFTKAHHLVFSYDHTISDAMHLLIEPYYQYLFDVPVIADSSFSLINLQGDWFFADKLVNAGKGRNYGIDLTFEKFMSKGYYYTLAASIFKSEYTGGDKIWRNTRFNRGYVVNILAGKEWMTGKKNQNMISINGRVTYQGGNFYSPVDMVASVQVQDIMYNERNAFSIQNNASVNVHFTAIYKINRNNISHEIALKVLNASRQPDFYGYKYNLTNKGADKDESTVTIPNISYKIEFR